jgi:hypothetical protein
MSTEKEKKHSPKLVENSLLVFAGLLAHAPLYYQLPRWACGLDPTFVHPRWIEQSPFPLVFHMAAVHPLIWIALLIVIFIRICWNYGWRLGK